MYVLMKMPVESRLAIMTRAHAEAALARLQIAPILSDIATLDLTRHFPPREELALVVANLSHQSAIASLSASKALADFISLYERHRRDADPIPYLGRALVAAQIDSLVSTVSAMHKRAEWMLGPTRDALRGLNEMMPGLAGVSSMIAEASKPGTFWGDFLLLKSADVSGDEKWSAICRMQMNWFQKPVHPRRWTCVKPELARRALENGTSIDLELELATKQALLLAVDDIDDETPVPDLLRRVRAALANYVTEDLAGPGWRQRASGVDLPVGGDELATDETFDVAYQAELNVLHQWFWAMVPDLPRAQRAALLAMIDGRPLTNGQHQALHRLRQSPRWSALQQAAS
jgi:hypothetical protein